MLSGLIGELWQLHPIEPVALGHQPALPDRQFGQLPANDGQFSPCLCVVQAQQNLSGLDEVAFAHGNFADDAAITMLDGLEVPIHLDGAGGDHGRGQLGCGSPAACTRKQQDAEGEAGRNPSTQAKSLLVVVWIAIDQFALSVRIHGVLPRQAVSETVTWLSPLIMIASS
ncbi:hypothetical protein GGR00_004833 [Aminobacter aganoensis]|uniref:Uncharacterized protein n=1 Tax=Aminobacter aganoensis TaxID=83264 RepID=A0A7X0KNC9_9HYPH|nr:hypothetical protein [Aminobacter aganoensis]